jgi:hypothetical protein
MFLPMLSTDRETPSMESMEIESNVHSAEVSVEMDSETPKSIRLPKTKKIRSVGSTGSSTVDTGQKPAKKYKKDERKNMYGYSFKFIVKEFLDDKYKSFFDKLCLKFGVLDKQEVRDFY